MTTKITLLITLVAYSFIVGQSFMYILAFKDAQMKLEANQFIELRKLIDGNMRKNFKYVLYVALIANLFLVISTIKTPGNLIFITSAIAFIALIADILLTIKGNLPINNTINSWTAYNYPLNWKEFRLKWFEIFQYRQLANITGFISLLIAAVFGSR